ncbi:response regulator receiver sensor signal transduction histidine kinase [Cellulomonas flavigena DSM 20109]|uniref:histidine kinase n=1 Tax=Cellulomonas flavigena (strain ATCC 482 / DSM 20109 / BCRC 11376 / JCM 18109 / NBRC 3775 / NCIMB 8073 / NRS 134) TaxID=446466 RepID=D5UH67_CELFN|nr:hybrid sensor histidine kinase/response regulator [Cellulomonas flavigena]ADG73270.1 response regulator receiver sensor signal transduction histidine kinase [Cellulomonas flavigena DSM 20109]
MKVPDRRPSAADNGQVTPTPDTTTTTARRAVVVDDEQALARLVAGYLERDGFEVSVTHDGSQAVGVLREVDPDVVVSRVPAAGLGAEFDDLAESFNAMAARLQEAERLRARLLADVAHEVRTPVATIAGYLEAVEDGLQPMDEPTMAVLRDQSARLTRLARDLAAVTRAEAGDLVLTLEPLAPDELLAATTGTWRERATAAGVDVRVQVDPELGHVRVDRQRMGQVLDNLVANALRHTPAGGTITLRATGGYQRVALHVSDTGAGIAPEHLPHLFERFYRADTARDRTHGGSGIGLAICKALTEAHGGTITATSDGPGAGASFTVTLPVPPG